MSKIQVHGSVYFYIESGFFHLFTLDVLKTAACFIKNDSCILDI